MVKTTCWLNEKVEWKVLNEELYQQYKTDFQRTNYLASENGLFEPDTIFIVSKSCGKGASYSSKYKELLSLIDSNNKTKIIEWCQSTSPEMRCYGAMGLSTLKRVNDDLNADELKLLERISKDETTIDYCSGCTQSGYNSTVGEFIRVD